MADELTLCIDSNYVCYMSKFAFCQGLMYKGGHTEVIFGFLKQLLELANRFETRKFMFCWDSYKSIRKQIYPQYKANRKADKSDEEKEQDEIAYKQFNELRLKVLPKLGFKRIYHQDGYESDDLIAAITINGNERYIVVSSDEDLYQLLDYCSMYNISKKNLTTKKIFEREYKIEPKQWIEVKKIAGCKSDNVDGAWRVGEVNAIKYLKGELQSHIKAYQSIVDAEKKGVLERNEKLVKLPLEGVSYRDYVPNELFYKRDFQNIFEEYGFNSYLNVDVFKKWVKAFRLI